MVAVGFSFWNFAKGKSHEIGKTLQNTSVVISRRANASLPWVPKKNALYLNVKVFTSTKILIDDTIFTSPTGEVTVTLRAHLSHVHECLAAFGAKVVPSFLSYFKTLNTGPALGIERATSRSSVKRSTDWANPARDFSCAIMVVTQGKEWLGTTDWDRGWGLRTSRSTIKAFLKTEMRV